MESKAQHGYLVLADISGYTSYLAATELEHAHGILTDLLELVVRRFREVLTIVKLEGDAVFAHVPQARLARGETLLELMEATYVAFRDRVEAIRRQTTCECNACRNIPMLDLKFLAHHGDYVVQDVAGVGELVGSDVNLIHRLLKNHVAEATGWRAYALFTERCLEHMCVRPEGIHEQVERYEHLGEVKTLSLDLACRYQELVDARRVLVTLEQAYASLSAELPAPPPIVWEWLNDPKKRAEWEHLTIQPVSRPAGRTTAGARDHCVHGKDVSVQDIVDWRPFDYFTVSSPTGPIVLSMSYQLSPILEGTHVLLTVRAEGPFPRLLLRLLCRIVLPRMYGPRFERLRSLIAAEPEPQTAPA